MKDEFKKFNENLRLTEAQEKDAKTKYEGVCKKLYDSFYEGEYNESSKYLFGSYKTKTNIRPLSDEQDVDVLFKIPKEVFDQFDNQKGNGQSQLLQKVRDYLKEKYTTTDKISGWGKVVKVSFAEGSHNVEILPAFEKDDETFQIPNTENGGSWEKFNPRKDIDDFQKSNKETDGLTADLTRMMKSWINSTNTLVYSSYDLINDVIDFLSNEYNKGEEYENYQYVVKDFLETIKSNKNDDKKLSHIETAHNRVIKAIECFDEDKFIESSKEWKKIFGSSFPISINTSKSQPKEIENPSKPWCQ